jgi:hypothetical protein
MRIELCTLSRFLPEIAQIFRAHLRDSAPSVPMRQRVADHLAGGGIFTGINRLFDQGEEFRGKRDAHLLDIGNGLTSCSHVAKNPQIEIA